MTPTQTVTALPIETLGDLETLGLRILAEQRITLEEARALADRIQATEQDADEGTGELAASIVCALMNADDSGLAYLLASHVDDIDADDLIRGSATAQLWANTMRYKGCGVTSANIDAEEAEYLADKIDQAQEAEEGEDRGPWSDEARSTVREVIDWFDCNSSAIALYMQQTGRSAEQVGHDFALSRAGHGTGLWDRGAEDWLGRKLHDAAKLYGDGLLVVTKDDHGDVTSIEAL